MPIANRCGGGRFFERGRALTRRREIATGRVAARLPERTHSGRLATRHRFGFLTLPNYSMIALTSAVEPLRMANRLCRRGRLRVVDREPRRRAGRREQRPRRSSPTVPLDAMGPVDVVFVCGGVDVQRAVTRELLAALRRLAQRPRRRSARFAPAATRSPRRGCSTSTAPRSTGRTCRRCARSFRGSTSPSSSSRSTATATRAPAASRRST